MQTLHSVKDIASKLYDVQGLQGLNINLCSNEV